MTDRRRSSKKQIFKTLQQPAVIFPSAVRGVCMYARPKTKLVAFLMCVCVYFRENKNQHQISSHVCTTHCDLWWRPAKSWEKICYGQKNKQSDKKHTSEGKTCKERWKPCKFRPFRRKMHEKQHGKNPQKQSAILPVQSEKLWNSYLKNWAKIVISC